MRHFNEIRLRLDSYFASKQSRVVHHQWLLKKYVILASSVGFIELLTWFSPRHGRLVSSPASRCLSSHSTKRPTLQVTQCLGEMETPMAHRWGPISSLRVTLVDATLHNFRLRRLASLHFGDLDCVYVRVRACVAGQP